MGDGRRAVKMTNRLERPLAVFVIFVSEGVAEDIKLLAKSAGEFRKLKGEET
jgi:hypothetical protein